ncbi:MAG: hypothetical protein ACREX0_02845, partial [Noviherbaspirillum sp.]
MAWALVACAIRGVILACGLLPSGPAAAHGFGQRYDLPLPLWLYLGGAGLIVALSFLLLTLFVRAVPLSQPARRINLLRYRIGRALASPTILGICRLLVVGLYLLTIAAGLFGVQSPLKNIAPAMVWAIWWVGMAYIAALIGDVWALVNPLDTLFAWAEALYARLRAGRALAIWLRPPVWLGVWPAVLLFAVFIWMELIWDDSDRPARLATAMLLYSALTWLGMRLFGRAQWLCRGDVFAIVFGLLARFAPTETRLDNRTVRAWNLRAYAVGLLVRETVDLSTIALVILVLASVSFDGFMETPAWASVIETIAGPAQDWRSANPRLVGSIQSLGLFVAPLLFLAVYLAVSRLIVWFGNASAHAGKPPAAYCATLRVAGLFVLTLMPISIAYHLAHYLSFLMMAGQYLIPMASDPFGVGWNLFGSGLYRIKVGIIDARIVWYVSLIAIVLGHVAAVYLAHVIALQEFPDRRAALRSQYPMLVLMVCYTMISLW